MWVQRRKWQVFLMEGRVIDYTEKVILEVWYVLEGKLVFARLRVWEASRKQEHCNPRAWNRETWRETFLHDRRTWDQGSSAVGRGQEGWVTEGLIYALQRESNFTLLHDGDIVPVFKMLTSAGQPYKSWFSVLNLMIMVSTRCKGFLKHCHSSWSKSLKLEAGKLIIRSLLSKKSNEKWTRVQAVPGDREKGRRWAMFRCWKLHTWWCVCLVLIRKGCAAAQTCNS